MITETRGNLLDADVDALVNTINTVGVMGKGIALQFRRAYPEMFADYARAAKAGEVEIGRMHVWATGQMSGPRYVINFPTKRHWRGASRLDYLEAGLADLVRVIKDLDIKSIAVPPLGCGNGGLAWDAVEPVIRRAFDQVPDVDVLLYPPGETPPAAAMTTREPKPNMTPGRAALITLMAGYAARALEWPSLIESQKLMYFLQESGEPLRLNFIKHHYGPYAHNLTQVLRLLEGHYISGFGDGSAPVQEAEPLTVLPGAEDEASPVLDLHPETRHRIERVLELAEGFETAYGLELLASVHWAAHEDPDAASDPAKAEADVRAWSPRKGRMFTDDHVRTAWTALRDHGWLGEPARV
jgi:Predicted phosphatase homologous to the C-terminal domain of histone macroH2A1